MPTPPTEPFDAQPGEPQTLRGVLRELEVAGYASQFGARPAGSIRCFTCRHDFAPAQVEVGSLRRLEGASDPDDMLAVAPLTCPNCGTRGTLVLAYGPEATLEDSEILAALPVDVGREGPGRSGG